MNRETQQRIDAAAARDGLILTLSALLEREAKDARNTWEEVEEAYYYMLDTALRFTCQHDFTRLVSRLNQVMRQAAEERRAAFNAFSL